MDDETLYRQLRRGDQNALAELVQRYHSPLYKFLCRFTGNPQLADDFVQDVFIKLITHQGAEPQHVKAWLYSVARNIARDKFRSAQYRYESDVDFYDEANLIFSPSTPEHTHEIGAALAQLSDDQREVILLRFYHDLKIDEIAQITHQPSGTIKSRLFQAIKRLKGLLVHMEISYDGS